MVRFMLDRPQEELDSIEAEERELRLVTERRRTVRPTAQQILDFLSQLSTLPKKGFLAGGAVANAYLSLIDGREYPVHDLDIFLPVSKAAKKESANGEVLEMVLPDIEDDRTQWSAIRSGKTEIRHYYDVEYFFCKKLYEIADVTQDGLINTIWIRACQQCDDDENRDRKNDRPAALPELGPEFSRNVLNGFDINACQAGIDLATGELFLSQAFMEFVENRVLMPWDLGTPYRTAIRLAKKAHDLGAELDIQGELSMLATASAWQNTPLQATGLLLERYRLVEADLEGWLNCEEREDGFYLSFDRSLVNESIWEFMRKSPAMEASSTPFRRVWNALVRKNTPVQDRKRAQECTEDYFLRTGVCLYDDFIASSQDQERLRQTQEFLLAANFTNFPALGSTLEQVFESVETIESLGGAGRLALWALESEALPRPVPFDRAAAHRLMRNYLEFEDGNHYINRIPLPRWTRQQGKVVIQELATKKDWTISRMHELVGDSKYISEIEGGYCRYFTMNVRGKLSIVEVYVNEKYPGPPKLGDHKTRFRRPLDPEEIEYAKRLERYLVCRYFYKTPKLALRNARTFLKGWLDGYQQTGPRYFLFNFYNRLYHWSKKQRMKEIVRVSNKYGHQIPDLSSK